MQIPLYIKIDWIEDLINQIMDATINYKQEVIEQL